MFCMNCGEQLPDGAKFCLKCGTKLGNVESTAVAQVPNTTNEYSPIKFVPAKCPNCGGTLQVNPKEKMADCNYCNSNFIVEQAINNYNIQMNGNVNVGTATININGANAQNLIARAKEFESQGKYNSALKYFDRVLDIDFSNIEAKDGIKRVNKAIEDYVYFRVELPILFGANELLEVRKHTLTHIGKRGTKIYEIDKLKNVKKTLGTLNFEVSGKFFSNTNLYTGDQTSAIIEFILNAQKGIYPEIE